MKTFTKKTSALVAGILSSVVIYIPTTYGAGAGTLADEPLFTTTGAKPNILFMVDDSGSMDTELITSDAGEFRATWAGTMTVEDTGAPQKHLWGYIYTYDVGNTFDDRYVAPSQAAADALGGDAAVTLQGVWRARNPDYNLAYYNPAVTYEPWVGVDETGTNEYDNAVVTAALENPFDANGPTFNLESDHTFDTRRPKETSGGNDYVTMDNVTIYPMTYWTWNGDADDPDNDKEPIEADERGTRIEIRSGNTYPRAATRTDCAADPCLYSEESKNFANWWQYHRRREYAMKGSMAGVIAQSSGTRMGIATINSNVGAAERKIAEMNDSPNTGNKRQLMDSLFSVNSGGNTPLNDALRDAGRYYECSGGPFSTNDCPLETTPPAGATESAAVCQQNFTILLTDGAYTDDNTVTVAGDADANGDTDFDGGPYADTKSTESNTLADIAMHYYERDLHTSINNKVPTQCGVDQNDAQHMVTYTVSFGLDNSIPMPQQPVLDITGQNCAASTVSLNDEWPERTEPGPDFTNPDKINELVHAAYNGRGQFYLASNAEELSASLNQALSNIADRTTGTGSGASFNASTLGTDSRLYLAQFDTERWSGDLKAFDIIDQDDINGGSSQALGSIGAEVWSAADELDSSAWANRHIWSHDGSVAGSGGGVQFEWNALSTEQQNDLRTNSLGTLDDVTTGQNRLNFIHGDRSNESQNGGALRQRDSRLGDIIQSGAVFVGIPALNWPDLAPFPEADTAESYSEFRIRLSTIVRNPPVTGPVVDVTSDRTEMVYVGANDGMLHGFAANGGAEQLAYIPSYLYSTNDEEGLHYLSDPTYTHRFGHDLTPTVSDIYTNSSWKSVLIGGHRAGATGFFALDVTDPSTFNVTSPVMWEFRGEVGPDATKPLGDPDLGYTFSKPTIVLTNEVKNGANRWAAVFGNGYNQSDDGDAQLFIVFLDPTLSDGWTEGSDYIKISTGSDGTLDDGSGNSIDPNGLSTPALVDLNGDGTVDRAYAGDLAGDMWAFDLCNRSGENCGAASTWDVAHKSGTSRLPLFNGDETKPITTQPQVIRNPIVHNTDANAPNLLVLFGTGRYISNGDNGNQDDQSFYGIWDAGSDAGKIDANSTELVEQTFDLNTTNRVVTDSYVDYSETGTKRFGWHVDLPETGERSVSDAVVRNGIVFFTTIIPSANPCDDGGRSFIMFLAAENGGQPNDSVFDFNNDGIIDTNDLLTVGANGEVGSGTELSVGIAGSPSFLGDTLYIGGTETATGAGITTSTVEELDGSAVGRLSWGELLPDN